jgi:hypothetical protein
MSLLVSSSRVIELRIVVLRSCLTGELLCGRDGADIGRAFPWRPKTPPLTKLVAAYPGQ